MVLYGPPHQPQMTGAQAKDAIEYDRKVCGAFRYVLLKVSSRIAYVDPVGAVDDIVVKQGRLVSIRDRPAEVQ
jgi:hypothetical protein